MKATVSEYSQKDLWGRGRHVRMASRVTFADGLVIELGERLSKREAIRQAAMHRPEVKAISDEARAMYRAGFAGEGDKLTAAHDALVATFTR